MVRRTPPCPSLAISSVIFLAPEQVRDQHLRKVNVLMPDPDKLSGAVHYSIEVWVNEGGAGGEDDGPLSGVLIPMPG